MDILSSIYSASLPRGDACPVDINEDDTSSTTIETSRLSASGCKRKRRKMETVTDEWIRMVGKKDIAEWQCTACEKCFTSERGARTHIYMQHVIPTSSNGNPGVLDDPSPSETKESLANGKMEVTSFSCDKCSRLFSSSDARYQHARAKHGTYVTLRPKWAAPTIGLPDADVACSVSASCSTADAAAATGADHAIDIAIGAAASDVAVSHDFDIDINDTRTESKPSGPTVSPMNMSRVRHRANKGQTAAEQLQLAAMSALDSTHRAAFHCEVCALACPSQVEYELHMLGLQPSDHKLTHPCPSCGKQFADERGLSQHMNFCTAPAIRGSKA